MTKTRRRILLMSSPLVGLAVLALVAKGKIDRLDAEALRIAETGQAAIRLFGEYAGAMGEGDLERVVATYDERFSSPPAGPWEERLRSAADGVRVYDWVSGEPASGARLTRDDVAERLASYLATAGSLSQVKLKLAGLEELPDADHATVRAVLWLRGERPGGEAFETHARFRFGLARAGGRADEPAGAWKIVRQQLLGGETVVGDRSGFTDVTERAGIDFVARHNPLFDTPEWRPNRFGIIRYGPGGASVADYDGDGWDDLFLADGAGYRLYRNLYGERPEGGFEDVTVAAGLQVDQPGVSVAIFADLDNDGDRDLYLSGFTQPSRLYENRGDGSFREVTPPGGLSGPFVTVAAAGDADGDGLLDLYLGRYLDPRTELPTTLFYTRNGEGNSLLLNRGGLRFEDVSESAGVREGGLALGVAWADYDGDGDQDLYVANDFGRNALLRNRGDATFEDVTAEAGALDFGYGMSATWIDVDNDLDLDLYVSNVHSGQRWYGQAPSLYRYLMTSVREGTIYGDLATYREIHGFVGDDWAGYGDRVVKGNSLLLNDGSGRFTDVAEDAGANPFGWYWGAAAFDYDNDADLDLYAANGWISGERHDDL